MKKSNDFINEINFFKFYFNFINICINIIDLYIDFFNCLFYIVDNEVICMKKRLLGTCPICDNKLVISELHCSNCKTNIQGEFPLSKFDYLSSEEQDFVLVFLKNAGNIKQIEKELNISYPTVRKMLDSVIQNLGFEQTSISNPLTRSEVLEMLKNDEISFEDAEQMLKEIK